LKPLSVDTVDLLFHLGRRFQLALAPGAVDHIRATPCVERASDNNGDADGKALSQPGRAGRQLAEPRRAYADRDDVVVLGLPRGGVRVAFENVAPGKG
jgi:hypothetical protein